MTRGLLPGLVLALLVALALRLPELDRRPMHNDEAVNAIKFRELWERGAYKYDPNEHHGPTLFYATLAWAKLTRAPAFVDFSDARFRVVTVLFGVGLILLLPLVADGLGRAATLCAALLTAISPAMMFYSRYYIHEMLLIFFSFLAIAAGWRYTRSRKTGWAILAGVALGLMQATKETFILPLAAAGIALLVNARVGRQVVGVDDIVEEKLRAPGTVHPLLGERAGVRAVVPTNSRWVPVLFLLAWLVTALLLFSSFFSNASGPLDAFRTYLPWAHRAAGASPHIHPWNFYLTRLAWFHAPGGPVWSEALILALALFGFVAILRRQTAADANMSFLRFIAFYTLALMVIYSAISYKTPWCLLGFWQGLILLAGVGVVALWNWFPQRKIKMAIAAALLAAAGQLTLQAWQTGVTHAADRRNPYVYAQTAPDLLNLVSQVDALAQLHPAHQQMPIKVMAAGGDYWPLPWYLRRYDQTGWWTEIPPDPYAPVMIVSAKLKASLDADKTHIMTGLYKLRPDIFLELYVESNLWRSYVETKPDRTLPE